jgi:cell division protein FtsL
LKAAAFFVLVLVTAFGLIKSRSGVIETGRTIHRLQKEVWHLKDENIKLNNEYLRLVSAEMIIRKNRELNLSLVPPSRVICVKEPGRQVAAVQEEPENSDIE